MKKFFIMYLSFVITFIFIAKGFSSETSLVIQSDSTWSVLTKTVEGWEATVFDDSAWVNASSPNPNNCGTDTYELADGIVSQLMWSNGADRYVYLRKAFQIENDIIDSAIIYSSSDDEHEIYINGTLAASDMNGTAGPILTTDIKPYIQQGKNVIAVYGINYGSCSGICFYAKILFSNSNSNSCIDSDGDGVPDQRDSCPLTPADSWVNKNGCQPTSGLYTEEQMNQMVQAILLWGDLNNDKKIGLNEAIEALRITSGITEPAIKK